MQNYAEMSAEARLDALNEMGHALYGTGWRKAFAEEFGITPQTLTNWKGRDNCPVWPCVAMRFALEARKLAQLRAIISV